MNGQAERPETGFSEQEAEDGADVEGAAESLEGEQETGEASEIDELQARADENWDKYLRAIAELENLRKRASRDVENARKYSLEPFARELLAVRDSLEMGLSAATEADVETLREGSEATLKLLSSTMEQFGIAELNPEGEPFDPEQHEAMMMQPSAETEPGTVLTVYQKGYALNGRLLRPARVVVADSPPAGKDTPETGGDQAGGA